MKLEVHERIALSGLLPTQADYAGLKAIRKFREIINFDADEQKYINLHQEENGRWTWDAAAASKRVLDAPVEEYIMDLVRLKLSDMNKDQTLTDAHVSLFEKFVIAYRTVS